MLSLFKVGDTTLGGWGVNTFEVGDRKGLLFWKSICKNRLKKVWYLKVTQLGRLFDNFVGVEKSSKA